jgi:RNA polymerase sigma-54 factor
MQNPLLEEVDDVMENEDLAAENSPDEEANKEAEDPSEEDQIDWSDYMQDGLDRTYVPQSEAPAEFLEKVPVTRTTLAESLREQLHFLSLSKEHLALAEFLVGSLDDRGWLATPLDEIAQATGRPMEEIEAVLTVIQALEPVGVGARDLRECLLIQLEARGEKDTLAWRLIHDQFDNLVNRRFPEISRQLKVSVEEVQAAADVIATLNPRPGLQVSAEDPKYVVPDLLVERVDDEYVVLLNDRHLPRLRISSAYEGVLRERKKKSEMDAGEARTREYIQGKLNSARWLIQTIEQRRRTMIKVMNCIIREQREFFDKGIAFLRPLTLQQVARQIDMHESTVSRVCSGKYVQTPRGVFELKFFFSSGLETEGGEDVSARSAKDIIRTLIEEEDKTDPLSDQKIAELLHERGLRIARRTVAKYREQLNILPARFRRRVA